VQVTIDSMLIFSLLLLLNLITELASLSEDGQFACQGFVQAVTILGWAATRKVLVSLGVVFTVGNGRRVQFWQDTKSIKFL
jgi:hypothetical protein